MTYEEFLEEHGVVLPIQGWEDLLFDYLIALEDDGYDIPVENIMEAVGMAQGLEEILADEDWQDGDTIRVH